MPHCMVDVRPLWSLRMTLTVRLAGSGRLASSVRTLGDSSSEPSSTTTTSMGSIESCARTLSMARVAQVARFHVAMTTDRAGFVICMVIAGDVSRSYARYPGVWRSIETDSRASRRLARPYLSALWRPGDTAITRLDTSADHRPGNLSAARVICRLPVRQVRRRPCSAARRRAVSRWRARMTVIRSPSSGTTSVRRQADGPKHAFLLPRDVVALVCTHQKVVLSGMGAAPHGGGVQAGDGTLEVSRQRDPEIDSNYSFGQAEDTSKHRLWEDAHTAGKAVVAEDGGDVGSKDPRSIDEPVVCGRRPVTFGKMPSMRRQQRTQNVHGLPVCVDERIAAQATFLGQEFLRSSGVPHVVRSKECDVRSDSSIETSLGSRRSAPVVAMNDVQ